MKDETLWQSRKRQHAINNCKYDSISHVFTYLTYLSLFSKRFSAFVFALACGAILTFSLAHFAVSDLAVAGSALTAVAALGVPADLRTDAVLLALIDVCEGEKRP